MSRATAAAKAPTRTRPPAPPPPAAAPSPSASIAAAQALAAAATSFAATQVAPSAAKPASKTSILPATSASHALLPYDLLSRDEQKMFQTKFRAAQKSPHLVEIQIKALDGLIAFLKQKRATAGATIQESIEDLARIAKDEANIHVKLDPLAARIASNQARRDELLRTKADADEQMRANKAVHKTQHAIDAFKRDQLKADMAFARGLTKPPTSPTKTTGQKAF
jgi:hypothetical protein